MGQALRHMITAREEKGKKKKKEKKREGKISLIMRMIRVIAGPGLDGVSLSLDLLSYSL